ncbi:MAG: sugar phosphate nucleotidyltransferase [Ignavibacteriales bacterium]
MKAVVMAGGEGTRLRPLTCKIPKPMVPVMDKPVMEYGLELLKKHGINDVAVTLQYLPDVVENYFGDGQDRGMNIRYFVEESPLGTAGSVKNAESFLNEPFIVISGDALTDFSLQEAIDFHRSRNALATLVLTRVQSPLEYGLVMTEVEGRIVRFLEKPSWGEVFTDTVNTGIYILEPEALDWIKTGCPYDFSRDLFPTFLSRKMPLYACVLEGYWCDIGQGQQYRQVHFDILDGLVNIEVEGERSGSMIIGKGSRISPRAHLEGPLFVGSGCEIAAGSFLLPYTVLGQGSIVESRASLKKTIVGKVSTIGRGTELRGAVLGKGIRVEKRCSIFEGAVIGDDSVLEDGVVINPEVKIWPNKTIETQRIVSESIVWSERVLRGLFSKQGIVGDLNSDLSPEKLAKLGRTLGSSLPAESRVLVGTDWSPGSAVAKNALLAGLGASGVEVLDVGRLLAAGLRFASRELQVERAVYLGRLGEGDVLSVRIVNGNGIDLAKTEERKLENLYNREEYRPVKVERLKDVAFVPDMAEAYTNSILDNIDIHQVKRKRYRVVTGANDQKVNDWMTLLLDKLGCDVIRVDRSEWSYAENFDINTVLQLVVDKTAHSDADLGVLLSDGGQKVTLVSPEGQLIQDAFLLALISSAFADKFGRIFLPVSAPMTLEAYARGMGREVVRTKSSLGEFMDQMFKAGEFEQLRLHVDGLYCVTKLLELMAQTDHSLEEMLQDCPEFYFEQREIPVSWQDKGRVIRRLAEEMPDWGNEELMEGIRVSSRTGSSFIIPDEDRPVCRIYTEAYSQEIAESLCDFYEEKIKQICQEED